MAARSIPVASYAAAAVAAVVPAVAVAGGVGAAVAVAAPGYVAAAHRIAYSVRAFVCSDPQTADQYQIVAAAAAATVDAAVIAARIYIYNSGLKQG